MGSANRASIQMLVNSSARGQRQNIIDIKRKRLFCFFARHKPFPICNFRLPIERQLRLVKDAFKIANRKSAIGN